MTNSPQNFNWQPLRLLRQNFDANVAALAARYPELAERLRTHQPSAEYFISTATGQVILARREGEQLIGVQNGVSPANASALVRQAFPEGACNASMMVAGIDQGWLWHVLFQLPCKVPGIPGFRPPLYLLSGQIEHLWTVLHFQSWQQPLADPRVLLFVGPDALEQARQAMLSNMLIPWPQFSVTLESNLFPSGVTFNTFLQELYQEAGRRIEAAHAELKTVYSRRDAHAIAEQFTSGRPLRVMGITSRYTSFLQHSMRDWLSAFERMGHETLLLIEQADHEVLNNVVYSETSRAFKPDLILMIDHYRAEFAGLPTQIPCVMWVQDQLPHLCTAQAGAKQGPLDYCLGFGRLFYARRHGYPASRYLPATIGVNDERFRPDPLTEGEIRRFGCDVSYVGHASTPAEVILTEETAHLDATSQHLIREVFEQLRAVYDQGGYVTQPALIRQMIDSAQERTGIRSDVNSIHSLLDFFTHKINNALFRHQTLHWLAEMDINLHLYGRGWENHPTLKRFARGIADNQTDLAAIYRASRINLQATPFGAVHQRLLDGLAAGGFFLIRYVPGDEIEVIWRNVWNWCASENITSDEQIFARATPQVRQWLAEAEKLMQIPIEQHEFKLYDALELSHDGDYIRSAAAIWDDYHKVAFRSADELRQRVTYFLTNESERRAIAESMRQPVIDRFTYMAISRRLLQFIAEDQRRSASIREAA